jgi:hypothetical protein
MKRLLKIVLIVGFTFVFTNCEKDDICDPNVTTTPRVVIEFYSIEFPSVLLPVTNLSVKDPNITEAMLFNGVSKIELPLKTFQDTTTFEFTINSTATNVTKNTDVVVFNYATRDIYVSRACGFKTYYDLSSGEEGIVIQADSNNWIKNKTIVNTQIESENDVHIKLFY